MVRDLRRWRSVCTTKGERVKRLLVVAASVAVFVLAAASGALAGEVKGPPGTPCPDKTTCVHNTNDTAAPTHASSACAFSGLNDMDGNDPGQTVSIVQTAADAFKYYGFDPGVQGTLGFCKGGRNVDQGN
jgi:hypothetical protein